MYTYIYNIERQCLNHRMLKVCNEIQANSLLKKKKKGGESFLYINITSLQLYSTQEFSLSLFLTCTKKVFRPISFDLHNTSVMLVM